MLTEFEKGSLQVVLGSMRDVRPSINEIVKYKNDTVDGKQKNPPRRVFGYNS